MPNCARDNKQHTQERISHKQVKRMLMLPPPLEKNTFCYGSLSSFFRPRHAGDVSLTSLVTQAALASTETLWHV